MILWKQKKQEWEKKLWKLKLMNEEDVIEGRTAGTYQWLPDCPTWGKFFFTREKFIFVGEFGVDNFAIKYSDIKEINERVMYSLIPSRSGPLVEISITADVQEKGKTKEYKCFIMRNPYKWIKYLSKKSGVPVGRRETKWI